MSQQTYFQIYMEIIAEGIKAIRKISFKRINVINDLITRFQGFLNKQVYGRIKPTNYLLLFLIALGSKNPKMQGPLILTIQKLFANNFIAANEDLSGALQFLKEEHKQFLLLPYLDYSNKTFQQLYLQTLVLLPERTQAINMLICKNMSLIFRLSQSTLPSSLISTICDFLTDAISQNKIDQSDKILKSGFLEIVRHAIESLKQVTDRRLLQNDQQISIKLMCERYGNIIADQVAIKINVQKNHSVANYAVIPTKNPHSLQNFQLYDFQQLNQKNQISGKFGWCAVCRKTANYYCRTYRIPVCGYQCKQINYFQTQELQKLCYQEIKSMNIFTQHVEQLCKSFSKFLSHPDIRRRTSFAQIFIHLSSQLRKINIKHASPTIFDCLQDIFRQCCTNLILQNEASVACALVIKKLIPLDIFIPQIQILLHELAIKLTHFITPIQIKQQTLKLLRDLIKQETLFQLFMNIDCHTDRKDVIRQVVNSISKLYTGIQAPEGITNLPPEDPNTRKACLDILLLLQKGIKSINKAKLLPERQKQKQDLQIAKKQKNKLKQAINRFNKAQKPAKVLKKLISQKYLSKQPKALAQWLHKNLKKLNLVNIGLLIGDHQQFGISIRDQFFHQIQFRGHMIDQGMRILLTHFTIPGQSQVVDRIIDSFSKQYFHQNHGQQIFVHSDGVFSFSYLLMMLQTNLHNPQVIQKMTLQQFSNLSKNMNGPGSSFPQQFLQKIYSSIQKKQLGFHSKRHQMETISAFQKNQTKRAYELHLKYVQSNLNKQYENIEQAQAMVNKIQKIDLKLLTQQCFGPIIDALAVKVRETDQKQELVKNIDYIQEMVRFSLGLGVQQFVALAIKNIWEQISRANAFKKYLLTQKMYVWVRQFSSHVYQQWNTIILSFSMFHRSKAIKKDNSNKNNIMVIIQQKCYLYDNYIESILSKSNKFNYTNLINLVDALIQISKQQIADNQLTFCLQKIGDVFQFNNSRLAQIVPMTWVKLKQHYIQLGKHKMQKVALFGTDFLKQLVTKFIKKKDLQFYQKQYLKPFQQIFNSNVSLGVKEYVVGGLSYFVNNYSSNIKDGWKIILTILCDSFEQDQDQVVKQKSHLIVRKLYETNFSMIDLDENYVDFVQILGRMARQKDDTYIKSCLQAIKTIIIYFESKLKINPDDPSAPQNQQLDIIFWQTMWLPLLSTIYGICGDFRPEVQNQSIQLLFHILMRYGKLFKYEFWKMIMQGILRPTFQQITYTSQSKPLRKKQLQQWLKNSFSRLFSSIIKLIQKYFNDFKLFLPDILKIYESCIISNSNRILTQLSTEALTQLLDVVGNQFQSMNWKQYIEFVKVVFKKSWPYQIQSLQSWKNAQENPEQSSYQGKILIIYLLLLNCQTTIRKFSDKLEQSDLIEMRQIVGDAYNSCHKFNKNIQLRQALWVNKFFQDMKSLPGLVKQQHEAIKTIILIKEKLVQKSQMYIDQYTQHAIKSMQNYKKSLILKPPSQYSVQLQQKQREGNMLQVILLEDVMNGLDKIGLKKLVSLGYRQKLFQIILSLCTQKSYCSKCKFCQFCETNGERQNKFSQTMKQWLRKLFLIKQQQS